MRMLALAAALAALAATPAGAAEIRHYSVQAGADGDHPGREYVVHGVRVVEGQPRWSTQRRSVMDDILAQPDNRSVTTIVNTFRRIRRD